MYEPVLVQALIPEPTIKRCDVGGLVRLARLNEAQRDVPFTSLLHHRLTTELLAVIGADHSRKAAA